MINANFLLGYPVSFQNVCKVYPPKIKEILEDNKYYLYKKILFNTQEDIEDEYTELEIPLTEVPTPLEYIFTLIAAHPDVENIVKDAFLFFIKEPVTILKDQQLIIVGDLVETLSTLKSIEDLRIIKEDNFFDFQNLLRESIGDKKAEPYNPDEHPKVRYFKAKARYRDKIKAKSKDNLTLGATLASICCMNFGLNPLNIGELSQCAVSILIRYYQEKDKYEIDIQSLLAGADSNKVKPQNWIRNIEDL